jgi:hypothetical protein
MSQLKSSSHSFESNPTRFTPSPLVLFDASHGQPNWSQTGFTSREMHSNYCGVMELLCRLGCVCQSTRSESFSKMRARVRLLVIPPPTGTYSAAKKCWLPQPECLFTPEQIHEILQFVHNGGRLLAFGYRFGDSFTRSNLRELLSPLGCILNDDAVIDLQSIREVYPLDAYFETTPELFPLAWSRKDVGSVRWRTMATFTLLPGTNLTPLALSAGGNCISFNRSFRRISFASLPIAVAGQHGQGRVALFGGPHLFEIGNYGLLSANDNAKFVQNVLHWLLDDGDPQLVSESTTHHSLGAFVFNDGLQTVSHGQQPSEQTVAYVERVLRRTGVLKALNRPQWLP